MEVINVAESDLYSGIATALLEKFAEPIVKGLTGAAKDGWEKFKIDFDISFQKYLANSVEKYGNIKTLLYRTEPKPIYDFFVCPNLYKEKGSSISGDSIDNLLELSHFLIVQGTGGIGKSIFLKHLFKNEVDKKEYIPVFIELKELNLLNNDYEISDFIFERLHNLGSTIKKEYMEYALKSGCFLFLFDGYDEIITDKKDAFFHKLDNFCDRFSNNYFIVSSRPYSEFIEFQRFSVLTLCNLTKEQALSLVQKLEFDSEIKQRFLEALDVKLYEQHMSFASNPLLLNIMLLTFDNYAEIPEKLHLFYANAFETLYSKHDATKSGFRRELQCKLSYDDFKKVFSYFCFITYYQGKVELTHEDALSILNKISNTKVAAFEPENYLLDLVNSICVLYKEGLNYKFTHRSFQEYFSAYFLKELSDRDMAKLGQGLVKRDYFKASSDSVFSMLRDMAEQRFEQNILLPLVIEFENQCTCEDKYDFYFQEVSPMVSYDYLDADSQDDDLYLMLTVNFRRMPVGFIYFMSLYYRDNTPPRIKQIREAENTFKDFLVEKRDYVPTRKINIVDSLANDFEMYSLFKDTWIGERLNTMANLRELLEHNRRSEELDLSSILQE